MAEPDWRSLIAMVMASPHMSRMLASMPAEQAFVNNFLATGGTSMGGGGVPASEPVSTPGVNQYGGIADFGHAPAGPVETVADTGTADYGYPPPDNSAAEAIRAQYGLPSTNLQENINFFLSQGIPMANLTRHPAYAAMMQLDQGGGGGGGFGGGGGGGSAGGGGGDPYQYPADPADPADYSSASIANTTPGSMLNAETSPGNPANFGYAIDDSGNISSQMDPGNPNAGYVSNTSFGNPSLGYLAAGLPDMSSTPANTPSALTGQPNAIDVAQGWSPGNPGNPGAPAAPGNPGYGYSSPDVGYDAGIGMGFGGATGDGTSGSTAASDAAGIGTTGNSTGISGGPGGTGEGGANTGEGGGGGGGGGGSK